MEAARLIVDVARLARDGERYEGALVADVLALDAATLELFTPQSALFYDLFVRRIDKELLTRGCVWQQFRCLCTRCGVEFEWEAREEQLLLATEIAQIEQFCDLTADLREAIILNFPAHPLCRADCRGLCARCGTNLNRSACDCARREESRWGALDALGDQ